MKIATHNMSSPKSVIESARKQVARMVDVKFADTFGTWQQFNVPVSELTGNILTDGLDGSSIRKWKSIEASDLPVLVLSTVCSTAETGARGGLRPRPAR